MRCQLISLTGKQSFDAFLDFDERAETFDLGHAAGDLRADRISSGRIHPRIDAMRLLQA